MALGLTQPLTETVTGNLPGYKVRPASKSDNLTAIYESITYRKWEARRLIILQASAAYLQW
jgi:hypothetical protein